MNDSHSALTPNMTTAEVGAPRPGGRIRLRALLLGLALAILICAMTPFNNTYLQGTPLGGGHFPLAPFFVLMALTALAVGLRRLVRGRVWLSGKELLFAWVLMVIVSGIAYTGLVRTFFINLTAPFHFATVGNRWAETLQPLLPKVLYPQSPEAVESLYNGLEGGRQMAWLDVLRHIPWSAWLPPLLVWSLFILLCYAIMICLVNIFSRQWIVNERMNFPLLEVPILLEETVADRGLGRFLSNPYLLIGLSAPILLHLMNGLNFYFPAVPQLPTLFLAGTYFPKYGLFSAFTKLKVYIYPAFIGFAFLTSRQISFSMWVFYLLGGLLLGLLSVLGYNIPASALGVTFGPHLTRPEEAQVIGSYGIFFLFIVWLARRHLMDVLRQAFGRAEPASGRTEWFSLRLSFWGLVVGVTAVVVWCRYFGLPVIAAVLVVGAFFMVTLVASRIICQGGIAYYTLTAAPIDGLLAIFGPGFFTHAGIMIAAAAQKVLFLDLRESLMPSLFHAGKMTEKATNKRLVFGGIVLALLAGVAVSFVAMLAVCYKFGIRELQLDWAAQTTVAVLENCHRIVETPMGYGYWVAFFSFAGALVMLILVVCYHRFYWWPLHPIGYLMAYSSSMRILWFSFLLGWLVNALTMRYGGVTLFKKVRFIFIGLIIGDFLMGGVWALVGLFGDASYLVLPD